MCQSDWKRSSGWIRAFDTADQQERQLQERHQVERVVVQNALQLVRLAGANEVVIGLWNTLAGYVVYAAAAAECPLQRLQLAVGEQVPPAAAGMMQEVTVTH
jgi:hypothetical protein